MNKPSCFLIGNTSLLIQCCDLLLNEKWVILGIISYDPVVTGYATRKNIPLIEQQSLKINFLKCSPFDYLFSIVNEVILGREVLELPCKLAINYHDSLLPEGAGVFSSTWALINRKEEHGDYSGDSAPPFRRIRRHLKMGG